MVEMSSMRITAHMDVNEVRQAFSIIAQSMKNTQKDSKSTQGDLKRLEIGLGTLGKVAIGAGAAFTGMIYEASRKAPALSGSMAVIKTSWDSIIRSLGEGLSPVFEVVSDKMQGVADWASSHPDLFAGVVGGVVTTTAVAGLVKLFGLGPALSTAATAIAPFLGPIGVGTVLAGLLTIMSINAGKNLAQQYMGELSYAPVPENAKTQIQNAKQNDVVEYYDLLNRYSAKISGLGGGGQYTPQIDLETGELYSTKHITRDVIRNADSLIYWQNGKIYVRDIAMNATDSYTP